MAAGETLGKFLDTRLPEAVVAELDFLELGIQGDEFSPVRSRSIFESIPRAREKAKCERKAEGLTDFGRFDQSSGHFGA